jgi:alpha-glucosidase
MTLATDWWKRGVIYQVYPRSFQDSDGDGIGDLAGIRSRLDYLSWLGIDALWISPIYPSPMADFGYDVSNYCDVDPRFGTLAQFDALVERAHALNIKVILDLVPNHTSDRHPWFVESRAHLHSAKRDWYIWRDPKPDGSPPNNWLSNFGGSAWERDPATGQYYYHAFLKEQPDLNWRNPEVRDAIYDVIRFWLDRGVDGFRVDVIWHLIKDAGFRDNPVNPAYQQGRPEIERLLQVHSADQPEVHEVIAQMRRLVERYPGRVLIGEIYLPLNRLIAYYGEQLSGAHLPFNFQLIHAGWNARTLASMIYEYEATLPPGGWPNWVLGNHDQRRVATRIGVDQARVAAMLLLTLRGTPTLYYGDEIGMTDVPVATASVRDPWELREPGLGLGRDPQRTPMQWDESANAGFTTGKPWLPLSSDYGTRNVAKLASSKGSILGLYRALIDLRRRFAALSTGAFRLISEGGDILAYERSDEDCRFRIFLNLAREKHQLDETHGLRETSKAGVLMLSTHAAEQRDLPGCPSVLRGGEGIIVKMADA